VRGVCFLVTVFFLAPLSFGACSSETDGGPQGAPTGPSVTPTTTATTTAPITSSTVPAPQDAGPEGNDTPSVPAVRYVGRIDQRQAQGPRLGWPGIHVIVRFQGTILKAKLAETSLFQGPSWYDVVVDGQALPALEAPAGNSDVTLATGLAAGTHVVELWRRTEGLVGVTQILSFDYGGGQLLPPPAPLARRIEFVGDSESAGYGLECASALESFTGATENERKGAPALIAEAFGAERSDVAYSGKGVSRNYDSDQTDTLLDIYGRSLPDDATSSWSSASWVPDLVFIAAGTNDYANPGARGAPDPAVFKAKYAELVALVRQKNPSAHIVCVVEGNLGDDYPVGWNAYTNVTTALQGVVADRNAAPTNDAKVHYYEFPRTDSSGLNGAPDETGCDGHPNAAWHQRAAADAVAKLKPLLGW
jgi:lysophospholipase L1-like esterase